MIEFVNLRKEYDDVLAVDDLALTIPQGEIFGLIGPDGAGLQVGMPHVSPILRDMGASIVSI